MPDSSDLLVLDIRVVSAFRRMRHAVLATRGLTCHVGDKHSELSRRLVRRIVHGLPQLAKGLQESRLVSHDQLRVRDEAHSFFGSREERFKFRNVLTVKRTDARHRFPPFAQSGPESSS